MGVENVGVAAKIGQTIRGVAQFASTFEEAVALLIAGANEAVDENDVSDDHVAALAGEMPQIRPEGQPVEEVQLPGPEKVSKWESNESAPTYFRLGSVLSAKPKMMKMPLSTTVPSMIQSCMVSGGHLLAFAAKRWDLLLALRSISERFLVVKRRQSPMINATWKLKST